MSLDLKGATLEWSQCEPGKSGFFYFNQIGTQRPLWEFAPSPYKDFKDFEGKPLKLRFYGEFSPDREKTIGNSSGNAILMRVGDVILARSVDDPATVYIVKMESQKKDKEEGTVTHAVLGK